ncbi:unnamed protein product [Aureobasidium pullulans]|nr:unnamed protein product [Aureobasidium pullulans]
MHGPHCMSWRPRQRKSIDKQLDLSEELSIRTPPTPHFSRLPLNRNSKWPATRFPTPSTSGPPLVVGTRNPRTGKPTLPSWALPSSPSLLSSSA